MARPPYRINAKQRVSYEGSRLSPPYQVSYSRCSPGTAQEIADDPLLTDRSGHSRRRPLLRVVVDSGLRLPLHSRLVQTANDDVLVLCSLAEEKKKEGRG